MKKRLVSMLLALAMAVTVIPMPVQAAGGREMLEVVEDNCPIRKDYIGTSDVVARPKKGAVLEKVGTKYNRYFNKWYAINYDGKTRYIYSENVKPHNHDYRHFEGNGLDFQICRGCGDIKTNDPETMNMAGTLALAGTLTGVDGPIPVGDIIGGILVTYAAYQALTYTAPAMSALVEQIKSLDFNDYLEKRSENVCNEWSFRRVQRLPGGLKYLDNYCMDAAEAYLWVAVMGGDAYTPNEDAALMVAANSYSGAICERDKDQVSYFYHYHMSTDHNSKEAKGHLFFGTNDLGEVPF